MHLREPSDAEKRLRDEVTHPAWGAPLDVPQYVQREGRLRFHPWSLATMRTWFWEDATGSVLASCETYRMSSTLRGQRGNTWGVASVYTEPGLRGKGHAGAMMRSVVHRLRSEPSPHGVILFSDVGHSLYERSGFLGVPAVDWRLPSNPVAPEGVEWLEERDIPNALETLPKPDLPFLIWPTPGQIDWHLERERFLAELHALRRPRCVGARCESGLILWSAAYLKPELAILLAEAPDSRSLVKLLAAAQFMAQQSGFERTRVWEVERPFAVSAEQLGAERVVRTESLPMLCPLEPGLEATMWRWPARALWM